MCACTETDVRESADDCILASGEGHGSRGETFQPIYVASPVSSSVEHPVYINDMLQTPGIYLGFLADDACIYVTDHKEGSQKTAVRSRCY
jgi:hypothetical protein